MILNFEELPRIRQKHKNDRIVLGGGVFDLIHVGHLEYIKSLREHGDVIVLLVKPDDRVSNFKDPGRPIIPEGERVRMVAALACVDYAFVGPSLENGDGQIDAMHEAVLEALQPDIFCSTNPVWEKLNKITKTKVIIGHRPDGSISTTKIIEKVVDKTKNNKYPYDIFQRVAMKAVIVDGSGKILILREAKTYEDGTNHGRYHFPGGRVEPGENFEQALKREVREETGLEVELEYPVYVGDWQPVIKGVPHQIIATFIVCKPKQGSVTLSTEHDDYQWLDPNTYKNYDLMDPDDKVIEAYMSKNKAT